MKSDKDMTHVQFLFLLAAAGVSAGRIALQSAKQGW